MLEVKSSKGAYAEALREWTRFCGEMEFSSFLADRRAYVAHLL
jgi:hypothetical protein